MLGCGLNLDNALPTRSLNQLLGEAGLPDLAREILTAEIFNTLEQLIQLCETGQEDKVRENVTQFNLSDFVEVFERYYQHWLHTNQKVKLTNQEGGQQEQVSACSPSAM